MIKLKLTTFYIVPIILDYWTFNCRACMKSVSRSEPSKSTFKKCLYLLNFKFKIYVLGSYSLIALSLHVSPIGFKHEHYFCIKIGYKIQVLFYLILMNFRVVRNITWFFNVVHCLLLFKHFIGFCYLTLKNCRYIDSIINV